MTHSKLRIGGAVVYWRLSPQTSLPMLADGLTALGLEQSIPEPRTPLSCLRAALADIYTPADKDIRLVVRPIRNEFRGFVVVAERPKAHAHGGDDWGRVEVVAKLNEESGELLLDPYDDCKLREVKEHMEEAAKWLPAAAVSNCLTSIVDHLQGVTLRDAGGVYWLNDAMLDLWARVGDAVEAASAATGKPSRVYSLRVVADEQMVRAVGDSLTDEVEHTLQRIETELQSEELKEAACCNRLQKVSDLERKVQCYEQAFSEPLTRLHEAVR